MKNTYLETPFLIGWNVTTAQIILKEKDDIDALCATESSPKEIYIYCYPYQGIIDKFWKQRY